MFFRDGGGVYRCEEFLAIPWLEHGFGTRLSEDWLAGRRVASLIQTHSAKVRNFGESWGILGEGDALIGAAPEGLLGIRTADCVPVLAVDVKCRAVAVVHAGWRGIVGGIVGAAVEAMERELGSRREDLRVAVGPAIGECCYEVGPEVAGRFAGIFEKWGNLGERLPDRSVHAVPGGGVLEFPAGGGEGGPDVERDWGPWRRKKGGWRVANRPRILVEARSERACQAALTRESSKMSASSPSSCRRSAISWQEMQ